jgi:hypothetical protein
MIVTTVALIAFDIVVASDKVRGNTISEIIRYFSGKLIVIPAGWMTLGGHFFSFFESWRTPGIITLCVLVPYGLALLIDGVRRIQKQQDELIRSKIVLFLFGIAHYFLGAIFWSQGDVTITP